MGFEYGSLPHGPFIGKDRERTERFSSSVSPVTGLILKRVPCDGAYQDTED